MKQSTYSKINVHESLKKLRTSLISQCMCNNLNSLLVAGVPRVHSAYLKRMTPKLRSQVQRNETSWFSAFSEFQKNTSVLSSLIF